MPGRSRSRSERESHASGRAVAEITDGVNGLACGACSDEKVHGMQAASCLNEFNCIHSRPGSEFLFRIILDKQATGRITNSPP
jgi:hypothetical protein